MNRKMMAIAMTAAGTTLTASAGWVFDIDWSSRSVWTLGPGPDIFAQTGVPVAMDSRWHADIVDKLTPSVVYHVATHEPGLGFWDQLAPGVAYQAVRLPPAAAGRDLMTRIYNHENPLLATRWAIHDPAVPVRFTWDPNAAIPPGGAEPYDFGTVNLGELGPQSGGDWVVIPEPGSAGMVVLGVAAILIRRMRERANI